MSAPGESAAAGFPDGFTAEAALLGALPAADDVIDAALRLVVAVTSMTVARADGVTVSLERRGRLVTAAATDDTALEMDRDQYATGQGPCVAAASEGRWFHVESLAQETRWPDFIPRAARRGIASILSTPLMGRERALGALNISSATEQAFGTPEKTLASLFAAHASALLVDAGADTTDDELSDRLRYALLSRQTIAQAQGVLMERHGVSAHGASAQLAVDARAAKLPLRQHATGVVEATRRPPQSSPEAT